MVCEVNRLSAFWLFLLFATSVCTICHVRPFQRSRQSFLLFPVAFYSKCQRAGEPLPVLVITLLLSLLWGMWTVSQAEDMPLCIVRDVTQKQNTAQTGKTFVRFRINSYVSIGENHKDARHKSGKQVNKVVFEFKIINKWKYSHEPLCMLWVMGYSRSVRHYFSTEYFSLCSMSAGSWTPSRLTSSRLTRPSNSFSPRLRFCSCPGCTPCSCSVCNFGIMQFKGLSLSEGSCLGLPGRPNLGRASLTKLLSLAHTY